MWALRDVSFEVKQGEILGIIGRNGAGKSTLLKILSRVTAPTSGEVRVKGRIASLLEVGTGFHPELTGRENIFLNGAILGMAQTEIRSKLDDIVAFAEIERYIDTPVKRYSSGMYVRLAFAVAAHLDPEILIVDEVLAVGDARFQERCLGKMGDVARGGRTIILVSHNMASVQQLCRRSLMLKNGDIADDGATAEVVQSYLSDAIQGNTVDVRDWKDRVTTGEARITKVEIQDSSGELGSVEIGGELVVRIHLSINVPLRDPSLGLLIHDPMRQPLLDLRSTHTGLKLGSVLGSIVAEVRVSHVGLYPGRYFLSPWIMDAACTRDIDFPRFCCTLNVVHALAEKRGLKLDAVWGKYHVHSRWSALPDQE